MLCAVSLQFRLQVRDRGCALQAEALLRCTSSKDMAVCIEQAWQHEATLQVYDSSPLKHVLRWRLDSKLQNAVPADYHPSVLDHNRLICHGRAWSDGEYAT